MLDTCLEIDDKNFFILYALSKSGKIDIPCLKWLYSDELITAFLEVVDFLRAQFPMEIEFYWNNNYNADINTLDKIKVNIEEYNTIPEILNTEIKYGVDFGLDNFESLDKKLATSFLGCRLKCYDTKNLQNSLKNYFIDTQEKRNQKFYDFDMQKKIYEKLVNIIPQSKKSKYLIITLNEFMNVVMQSNYQSSRYSLFHLFYFLEKTRKLNVKELVFLNNTPAAVIYNSNNISNNPEPYGKELGHYEVFSIYENKVILCSKTGECKKISPQQFAVFEYCFNNSSRMITYENLAKVMCVSIDKVPQTLGKNTKIIKDLLKKNTVSIFENHQKEQYYILTNKDLIN